MSSGLIMSFTKKSGNDVKKTAFKTFIGGCFCGSALEVDEAQAGVSFVTSGYPAEFERSSARSGRRQLSGLRR
jgi:hypothetical protein